MNKKKVIAATILGATAVMTASCVINIEKDDIESGKDIVVEDSVDKEMIDSDQKVEKEEVECKCPEEEVDTPVEDSGDNTTTSKPSVEVQKPSTSVVVKPENDTTVDEPSNSVVVKPVIKPEADNTIQPEIPKPIIPIVPEVKPELETPKPQLPIAPEVKPEVKPESPEQPEEDKPVTLPDDNGNVDVNKPNDGEHVEDNDMNVNPDNDQVVENKPETLPDDVPVEEIPEQPENIPSLDGSAEDDMGVVPSAELTDKDLTDGELVVSGHVFEDLHINVSAGSKITLEGVEIKGKLTLQNGKGYTVEIKDSSVKEIELKDSVAKSVGEEVSLILTNVKDLQTVDVNGDISIGGDTKVPNLNISGGSVLVDVLSDTITINKEATGAELTVNQEAGEVNNGGVASVIKANSNISTITSNGENTSVYIKEDAVVGNAIMNGDSERVMGNGTLENATVNGSNVGILTNIDQNNVTVGESASEVTVGKEESVKVESIKLGKQGTIRFTLNEATEKPLTLNDISIICHGGKSMTILNVSTDDNKNYKLSTAYYKDNDYELYITLPNNKVISKEFVYSYNHPTASKIETNRAGETEATIDLYDVDEGGYLYYVLVEKAQRNAITADYIKQNGVKEEIASGFNEVKISGLDANKQYSLHYVMEAFDGRTSPVYSELTVGEYVAPEADKYVIESVEEKEINKIVFNFNKPVEKLTLDDIQIKCPLGTDLTTTNGVLTPSNGGRTWTLTIPENYRHADNKYTVTIKAPDGNYIQGTFVAHFNYPLIIGTSITRPSEDKVKFEFTSDERGTVYYGLYEWNGEYNNKSNNPKADDVLNGKVEGTFQKDLVAGSNVLELDVTETTKYTRLFVLYVDYAGNYRTGWTDYHNVPAYVPPVEEPEVPEVPEVESTLEITAAEVYEGWSGLGIDLTFNEELGANIAQSDIKLESLSGVVLPARLSTSVWTLSPTVTSIEFMNVPFQAGEYRITVQVTDEDGNKVELSKEFIVE